MRVLLAIAELGVGGAERVVVELADALTSNGHAVAVLAGPGRLWRELPTAVDAHRLPQVGRSKPRAALAAVRTARAVRAVQPDVVHAHNVKVTAICDAGARLARHRRPLLTTFHGVAREEYGPAARILRRADRVACVSTDLAQALVAAGLDGPRAVVIPNGIAPVAPLGDAARAALDAELDLAGAPVVAMVGRLVPQKAPDSFLEVAAAVARTHPQTRFLVVGDGPLRAGLEARARDLQIAERVRFTGVRSDARALIARASLLLFTSDWEGLSIAALEALSAGIPVVSTAVEGMQALAAGGAVEIVPDRAPEALARAVGDLLSAPARRTEMGERGRALVAERFSLDAMTGAYAELYRSL
jgi:glycosyltransferase involved in cell wall biosynthesis